MINYTFYIYPEKKGDSHLQFAIFRKIQNTLNYENDYAVLPIFQLMN